MRYGATLWLLVACGAPDEEIRLPTSHLLADIQVSALTDDSAEVVVKLQDQDALQGELYELALGEEVTVTLPGIVISLISARQNAQPVYTATVPEPPTNTTYVVAFNRVPPDKTASASTLSLPQGMTLEAPSAFSRATEALDVTWDNSGREDRLEIELNGACFETFREEIPDSGSYSLPAGTLAGTGDSCPANLTLTRLREGFVDTDFAGGQGVAYQQRNVPMTSDP